MEKFRFTYSTKNIPLPLKNDHLQRLIEKAEQFLHRMIWKAYLYLNPGTISNTKDTYGFKSTKNPLLIAADKTTNFYKLEPTTYNDLLEQNITKSYKKAQPDLSLIHIWRCRRS